MASKLTPNNPTAALRFLDANIVTYRGVQNVLHIAITPAQWATIDPDNPASLGSRFRKEMAEADAALANQTQIVKHMNELGDRLAMYVAHFHIQLDGGITRGDVPSGAGARVFYKRDINGGPIPSLKSHADIAAAAANIVAGEAARLAAEGPGAVTMPFPSAAQVGALATQFTAAREAVSGASTVTDLQREDVTTLYPAVHDLIVDMIEQIEFFFRKDKDPASFRAKCARWGIEYYYGPGEEPPPEPTPPTPPTPPNP